MDKWITYDGRVVDMNEMSHQHMSNIYWFINVLFPESYNVYIRHNIRTWLNLRFKGEVLPYSPKPEFVAELNYLRMKGYLKENNKIVIDGQEIGKYKL
jgi:hypothetical protein